MPGLILDRVLGALEKAGIPCMLTGSFASSYHGAPRSTQDIDLVIAPTAEQIRTLVGLLPRDEFYVDEGAALEALRHEGQFNVIDLRTGWKIDLIVRKSRPFSHEEFGRRRKVHLAGTEVPVATPEDVIIAKMEWARMGESARQLEDAAKMLRVRSRELNRDYLEHWVRELRLEAQWAAVQNAAKSGADSPQP
ncbi:MAG TPA: nucleotidyl transferase AbiEii/AbiGii toxin family protein [Longimicrobium sp.]|nr:nucleotidyl transferase AbiEii/AbiGii toxin family protein [Longimicrobium sp.]